jgi:hypothetical protein
MAYSLKDILKYTQEKDLFTNKNEYEIAGAKVIDSKAIGIKAQVANANAKAIGPKANAIGANANANANAIGANAIGANAIGANAIGANAIGANAIGANAIGANAKANAKANAIGARSIGANAIGANAIKRSNIVNTQQSLPSNVPRKIFIIPYRNRKNQKKQFLKHMTEVILVDEPKGSYEIYFAHQYDSRPFNRGAMKNIGFLAMKKKYPLYYKQITFIFNDVDTYPSVKGMIGFDTIPGIVKHYYGYEFALGGIFAIKGIDFNTIQDRALAYGLTIDRSEFYHMRDNRIIRAFDGFERVISKRDSVVYKRETPDNITSLNNLKWFIENEYINITHFESGMDSSIQEYSTHDIRSGNKLLVPSGYDRRSWKIAPTTHFLEKV